MLNIILAILILNGVILFHEFGHYIVAKKNGVNVLEFSLGFGPRLISYKSKGTRFSLKLLLFGGSCVMQGEHNSSVEEGSFNNASVYQRAAILGAGPAFNVILAFLSAVFIAGFFGVDRPYISTIDVDSPAYVAGVKKGDLILNYNGKDISNSREFLTEVYNNKGNLAQTIKVSRNGDISTFTFNPKEDKPIKLSVEYSDITNEITSIDKDGIAYRLGLRMGDIIKKVDGIKVTPDDNFNSLVNASSDGHLKIEIVRKGKELTLNTVPAQLNVKTLGFSINREREMVSDVNIFKAAFGEIRYYVRAVLRAVESLFNGSVNQDDLAGPIDTVQVISKAYTQSSNNGFLKYLKTSLLLITLLSSSIGLMNLVPFPALDGFQLVLFAVEAIGGRPINKRAQVIINYTGFAILMLFMIWFTIKDIWGIIIK